MSNTTETTEQHNHITHKSSKLLLLLLYCTLTVFGGVGAPMLQKLYFMHGGSLKWFQGGLQSFGIFILFPQIAVLFFRNKLPIKSFFLDFKLFYMSVCIGTMVGLVNYLCSVGLSRLPMSTFTLLTTTQLAFTALFTFLIVKQKFTSYSSNAIVAIILGAVVLGLHSSSDRPSGITSAAYLIGFFMTLSATALSGLSTCLYQLAFSMSSKTIDYLIMLQVVLVVNLTSSLFAVVGMLSNKEFQAIPKEAKGFSMGEEKYWLIIVASAILWQLTLLGITGTITCKSSLFASICTQCLNPITQVASIVAFHERFTVDKGLSLALCIWGFTTYFIGENKMTKEMECIVENIPEVAIMDTKNDIECPNCQMRGKDDNNSVKDD